MKQTGWRQLFADWSWARGEGRFPIAAYSEFMPPPRIGQKPYGVWDTHAPFEDDDPFGWHVSADEEARELAPGLLIIARQLLDAMAALATGKGASRIGRLHLENNPYWPRQLAEQAAQLGHERSLFLSPLALAKTQDDKGRVRWTLFGGSHRGPARGFWKSFQTAPDARLGEAAARDAIRRILATAFTATSLDDLAAAGFAVLPTGALPDYPDLADGTLPEWTHPFLIGDHDAFDRVRYLLTFRPFALLPDAVRQAYFAGLLHLLPSPASLVFWGSPHYRKLDAELPFAKQILLLQAVARHASPKGIRVPQSGWLHANGHAHDAGLGPEKHSYRRTHRWQRMNREDDSTVVACEDHLHKVLFSAHPDDVGLYDKPMARNAQIWSREFRAVLNGPEADGAAIRAANAAVSGDRSFGYRFYYPPMQAGHHAIFWHRPLIAFRDGKETKTLDSVLRGFFATDTRGCDAHDEVELWPRFSGDTVSGDFVVSDAMPEEEDPALAQRHSGPERPKVWSFAERAKRAEAEFAEHLGGIADPTASAANALTFADTATRAFEVDYWNTIASLAEGRYLNKNTADTTLDPVTQARIPWPLRDLDKLGDHILDYYRALVRETGVPALVGEFAFPWRTDFDFPWMDGWLRNQKGATRERNLVVVIPGRNRKDAIVMADHYDTAYMEDVYGYRSGRNDGARMAACGADDNHSATSCLMLGARSFFALSRAGRLERDIWLVHLTGEEFPSDCLGARDLAQKLVEGTCKLETGPEQSVDLSDATVRGLYVLDMIAHNNEKRRDIFQIAPGSDRLSLWLAFQAQTAARMWAEGAAQWNAGEARRTLGRARRSPHGAAIPLMAKHLAPRAEIRFQDDPRSTLFNTDGQIFADAGIPVVLFMENYDINREGYHDTQDTMANIDLDYGAAVAAIAIESVARAATEALPEA